MLNDVTVQKLYWLLGAIYIYILIIYATLKIYQLQFDIKLILRIPIHVWGEI